MWVSSWAKIYEDKTYPIKYTKKYQVLTLIWLIMLWGYSVLSRVTDNPRSALSRSCRGTSLRYCIWAWRSSWGVILTNFKTKSGELVKSSRNFTRITAISYRLSERKGSACVYSCPWYFPTKTYRTAIKASRTSYSYF